MMQVEFLEAAQDEIKGKAELARRDRAETEHPVTAICQPLRLTTMVNRRFGTAYNTEAQNSSLGIRSPHEYRQHLAEARE